MHEGAQRYSATGGVGAEHPTAGQQGGGHAQKIPEIFLVFSNQYEVVSGILSMPKKR